LAFGSGGSSAFTEKIPSTSDPTCPLSTNAVALDTPDTSTISPTTLESAGSKPLPRRTSPTPQKIKRPSTSLSNTGGAGENSGKGGQGDTPFSTSSTSSRAAFGGEPSTAEQTSHGDAPTAEVTQQRKTETLVKILQIQTKQYVHPLRFKYGT
jgi:hypothetical protein